MGSTFSCRRADEGSLELPPRQIRTRQIKTYWGKHRHNIVHVHNEDLRKDHEEPKLLLPYHQVSKPVPPEYSGLIRPAMMARDPANRPVDRDVIRAQVIDLISDDEDEDIPPYDPIAPPPPLDLMAAIPAAARANMDNVYLPNVMHDPNQENVFHDFDDFDIQDPGLERAMIEQYNNIAQLRAAANPNYRPNGGPAANQQENLRPERVQETRAKCVDQLEVVFPGICLKYVSELYDTVSQTSDALIAHILDKLEKGTSYPSSKEMEKSLKRKRELDEDEEAIKKYGAMDRILPGGGRTLT